MAISDISGKEIPPGTGGSALIVYARASREDEQFSLTAAEAEELLEWAKATPPTIVLTRGRRSDLSGRVIGPDAGATLQIRYYDDAATEQKLEVHLTDDEVANLTGRNITRSRLLLAVVLAVTGTVVILALAWVINSGLVVQHPAAVLATISALTILVATLSWKALERVSSRVVVLASGIAVVLTTLFAIVPNIGPGTKESGTIGKITMERGVSLAQYYRTSEIHYLFRDCGKPCLVPNLIKKYCAQVTKVAPQRRCPSAPAQSEVVYVPIDSVGYISQKLFVRWRLFNAHTDTPIRRQPRDALGTKFTWIPIKRDSDSLTVPLWIDASAIPATKLVLRIYLSDKRGLTIATATSPVFSVPRTHA